MVDGMFVGKGVGPQALASVNLSMPYINMIFAFALMIAVGASTRITYHFGQKKLS
ncbi:MATE family efflux transporter [Erysipelothrix piscisicarius]|uniref:MATE family efflux transporter n=1 Tax=Erysipelothrix piscisicarius TaxID=2485784 RepID=UPI002F9518B7